MKNKILGLFFFFVIVRAEAQVATEKSELFDYSKLNHELVIKVIRAGNHSPSGISHYYFQVTLSCLLNSKEERALPTEKRKKTEDDLGKFGDIELRALSLWHQDEKLKDVRVFPIHGDKIREAVAKTMTELKVKESDIYAAVSIKLFDQAKKFFIIPDDQLIAATEYEIGLQSIKESRLISEKELVMKDEKGLEVRIDVREEKKTKI